ncbi:MAG: phage protein [Nannocystaceae bacterium]
MDTYAFKNVIFIMGGIPITGFAEGDDVIQIGHRNDIFTLDIGADGNGVASQSADESGEIIIRLQQTSQSNTFLSLQFALMSRGAIPSIPFLMKDAGNLFQIAVAAACVIQKPADSPRGTGLNDREWTFLAEKLIIAA